MQENIEYMMGWLKARGITDTVIAEANIHWSDNSAIGSSIVIPVYDVDGNFLFNKYRRDPRFDIKPKYVYDAGGKTSLYGAHEAKKAKQILITEGEMDSLVARSANIPAVTSTGGSMSFQGEWVEFFNDKEVLVCFDNDEAGAEGMVKVLKFLPKAKIIFIPEQPGVKDISDYVARGGNLVELLRTAMSFETIEQVKEDRARRNSVWLPTRFHDIYIETNTPKVFPDQKKNKNLPEILQAKQYPINKLIEFKEGKAPCLWHSEKTPSMHYYLKSNTVYCFGCGKHGDAIDVIRQIRNCTFTEAIKHLL